MENFKNQTQARKHVGVSYLGTINSSAKIIKNRKIGIYTYILYLSPAKTSGYNVCSHSTAECRLGCLAASGRAMMEEISGKTMIKDARLKKTRLFFENQPFFMDWLISEIKSKQAKAKRDGFDFSVRLNGTSDIDWNNVYHNGKNIFQHFPKVMFYDYTKNASKFIGKPNNYHLTLSYTGRNWSMCETVLKRGHNVAVVFNIKKNKPLPETFNGYRIVDGDVNDVRYKDGFGVIVGLRFKEIANKEASMKVKNSIFVVRPDEVNELKLAV